mgnify:CR=1 FL=1
MQSSTEKGRDYFTVHSYRIFACLVLLSAGISSLYINFPPGDSWTHGWTVDQWLKGNFVLNDWSSAVALPQQFAGWIVNFGSETVQWWRLSLLTAIVTVAGCIVAGGIPARLFPEIPSLKNWSPLFAIVILAMPFTLKAGAGFMTDGYYFILLTSSLWFLIGLTVNPEKLSDSRWFMGWSLYGILALLASLQRSHGFLLLVLPAIFIILFKSKNRDGWSVKRTTHAITVCLLGFVAGIAILAIPFLTPARSGEVTSEMASFWLGKLMPWSSIASDRFNLIFGIFQHLGFALLPLVLFARPVRKKSKRDKGKLRINWWFTVSGAVFLLYTFFLWADNGKLFPYLGNSVTSEGFGPRADTITATAGHRMSGIVMVLFTCLGTLGGMWLLWLMTRAVKIKKIDWLSPQALIGILGIGHLALVIVNPHFFDRYFIPLMPFILCWMAPMLKSATSRARVAAWILALIFLAISIIGTFDYLGWTKSKWELSNELRSRGIQSDRIVGGYEVDGFFNFTNENYPGLNFGDNPMLPWWVDRLGLPISPDYIVVEKGASLNGTPWDRYSRTIIENGQMCVYEAPVKMPGFE